MFVLNRLSKEENNIHNNQSVVIENRSSHHQLKKFIDDCIIAIWINEFLTLSLSIFTLVGTLVGILPVLIVADSCSWFANYLIGSRGITEFTKIASFSAVYFLNEILTSPDWVLDKLLNTLSIIRISGKRKKGILTYSIFPKKLYQIQSKSKPHHSINRKRAI